MSKHLPYKRKTEYLWLKVKVKTCCVNCKNEFFYIRTRCRGHRNPKQFCSQKCKSAFNRYRKTSGRTRKLCKFCKKIMFIQKCKSRSIKYCSLNCKSKMLSILMTKLVARPCKICSKPTKTRGGYCSDLCFSNRNGEKKFCEMCKVKKVKHRGQRFCSKECQFKAQSCGLVKIHTIGARGHRKDIPLDICFMSTLEADYARYLMFCKIEFKYSPTTFKTEFGEYTPDYYIINKKKYIELKGIKGKDHVYKNICKLESVKKSGIRIEKLYGRDFYSMLKRKGLYKTIPNLERNTSYRWKGYRKLICRREEWLKLHPEFNH